MTLVPPHGKGELRPLLAPEDEAAERRERAAALPALPMSSREASDLVMLGIGAFTPLEGFMGAEQWRESCERMALPDGTFWPIPITLSASREAAEGLSEGDEVALVGPSSAVMGTMVVEEVYPIDKQLEANEVFRTTDAAHPGVAKLMAQGPYNIGGRVSVLDEGGYPQRYPGVYLRPEETRRIFDSMGWSTVAAFQTRNPMHRAHEYLAKVAVEVCDGVLVHQLLGELKPGDVPAEVRVRAVDALVSNYFVPGTCVQAGYPMEMRYAGPREALLHALFRQNYGCSHLIVGRDHAGVGSYYGPNDAQRIFDEIPPDALVLRPLRIEATFFCRDCDAMASARTCPHPPGSRLLVSGTELRRRLREGEEVPHQISRPEVLAILREYYASQADPPVVAGG